MDSVDNNVEKKEELLNNTDVNIENEVKTEEIKSIEPVEKVVEQKQELNSLGEYLCLKCGTPLKEEQQFCPKCGTARGETNNKKCDNCGTVIEAGEKFCSKCGNKVKHDLQEEIAEGIHNIQHNVSDKKNKKKLIAIVGGLIAIIIFCVAFLPGMLVTTSELLAEGNYEAAYKKAKKDEKEDIVRENLIAYISYDASETLKDPSSFVLRDAWYDKKGKKIVLHLNGNNSYGASVSGYWFYTFDKDENEFQLYTSLSSLEKETIYSSDYSSNKWAEKYLKNLARETVKTIINNDTLKIGKSSIDNINDLFEKELLDDVKLLPENENLGDNDNV